MIWFYVLIPLCILTILWCVVHPEGHDALYYAGMLGLAQAIVVVLFLGCASAATLETHPATHRTPPLHERRLT